MSKALPLVSVLIPCFHARAYVHEAVECALRQSYGQIEVVLAPDDGYSYAEVTEAARTPRLRVIPPGSTVGTGAGAARNRALDAATGDFFAVLDADDLIPRDYIEKLMDVAVHEGAATGNTHYTNWASTQVVRVPPIDHDHLDLPGFGRALASIHPLIQRELEPGYVEGFAEDVVHDGLIFAKLGAVPVVPTAYQLRLRRGSVCSAVDAAAAEASIQTAYQHRIEQILSRPAAIGADALPLSDRHAFADLFRFRAMVSRMYSVHGSGLSYNAFVAGNEARLWDQFLATQCQETPTPSLADLPEP